MRSSVRLLIVMAVLWIVETKTSGEECKKQRRCSSGAPCQLNEDCLDESEKSHIIPLRGNFEAVDDTQWRSFLKNLVEVSQAVVREAEKASSTTAATASTATSSTTGAPTVTTVTENETSSTATVTEVSSEATETVTSSTATGSESSSTATVTEVSREATETVTSSTATGGESPSTATATEVSSEATETVTSTSATGSESSSTATATEVSSEATETATSSSATGSESQSTATATEVSSEATETVTSTSATGSGSSSTATATEVSSEATETVTSSTTTGSESSSTSTATEVSSEATDGTEPENYDFAKMAAAKADETEGATEEEAGNKGKVAEGTTTNVDKVNVSTETAEITTKTGSEGNDLQDQVNLFVVLESSKGQYEGPAPPIEKSDRVNLIALKGGKVIETRNWGNLNEIIGEIAETVKKTYPDVKIEVPRGTSGNSGPLYGLIAFGVCAGVVTIAIASLFMVKYRRRRNATAYMRGQDLEAHEMFSSAEILDSESSRNQRYMRSLQRQAFDISSSPYTHGTFRSRGDSSM